MLQKGEAEFYEFEPNALVFKKQWVAAAALSKPSATTIAAPKVFSGVVSQSAIALAVPFTPRQDDLIENMDELREAVKNNEAPFMASLPGRIIREIKIVSSVITKDGFTQRGTAQQIVSGTNKDGTNKYRTVVNKFAIADIYILTEKGVRTKISRIVYGPVDSAKFRPDQSEITTLQSTIKTAPPAVEQAGIPEVAPVPVTQVQIVPRDYFVNYDAFYTQVFYIKDGTLIASPDFSSTLTQEERGTFGNYGGQTAEGIRRLKAMGYPVDSFPHKIFHNEIDGRPAPMQTASSFEEFFGTTISVSTAPAGTSLPAPAVSATTLYEFYTAQGQSLPSVSQRSILYEALGLGQASFYTGTAEQNTKLLAKLQGKF